MEYTIDRKTAKIVKELYCQADRFYHTFNHIKNMVNTFNDLCSKYTDILNYFGDKKKNDFYMAILFHDVVCKGKPSDIYESVKIMKNLLKPNKHDLKYIQTLIEATSHNRDRVKSFDEQLIHDLDLDILGKEETVYEDYAENIRKEFSNIDDKTYSRERINFIDSILYKPIYYTKYFSDKEEKAKENLSREKNRLSLNLVTDVERFFSYISVDRTYITAEEVLKLMELLNKEHDGKIKVSLSSIEFVHDILSIFIEAMETNKFKTITEKEISDIFVTQ